MEPSEKDIDPQLVQEPTSDTVTAPDPDQVQAVEDEVQEPVEATLVEEAPVEATTDQAPATEEPVDLISPELAAPLAIEDAEPPVPVAPDLEAVQTGLPSTSGPATNLDVPVSPAPVGATNLDLPSIDLPHPAYPEPQQVPPAAAYQSPGQAYGQTPYSVPTPPPASPYGQTPYAVPQGPPPQSFGQTPYAVPEPPPAPYGQGQQFSQPAYPPPAQYGQQLAYPAQQLNPSEEATWSSAAHWSAILASFIGLGFLGPLIVMLTQGTKSARVRANAVESLNFEITFVISMVISVLLMLVVVGFVTTFLLPVAWLVFRIIASIQTSNGQDYRYPLNIRLVK